VPEFRDAATHNGWQNLAAELRRAPENAALRLLDTLQYLNVRALDHFLDAHDVSPANPEQSVEFPRQNELGPAVLRSNWPAHTSLWSFRSRASFT
jgi:hypothetical protein